MWFWIIAIVIAIVVYFVAKPRLTTPDATVKTPEVADGRKIRKIYGTVWIEDPTLIGFKLMGTIPIKSGGKK